MGNGRSQRSGVGRYGPAAEELLHQDGEAQGGQACDLLAGEDSLGSSFFLLVFDMFVGGFGSPVGTASTCLTLYLCASGPSPGGGGRGQCVRVFAAMPHALSCTAYADRIALPWLPYSVG